MNKLADWLKDRKIKRQDFAKQVGVSAPYMTGLCQDPPRYWASREVWERIGAETNGEITPNDFVRQEAAE